AVLADTWRWSGYACRGQFPPPAGRSTMNTRSYPVLLGAALLVCAVLLAGGCARTKRDTVFSSGTLKVVAVTESRLDINVSKYQHYTTYEIYVDGS
ncbi:hypothetical protein DSI28_09995, partial [Mycobacterium tuberculosis]